MRLGSLLMPSHPPERSIADGQALDLEELIRLDSFGFQEAWIGEHFTSVWEPCPAPDLLIAQALEKTRSIQLGSLGHLLPYHHPIELAHRAAYLDHLAKGRYALGVGISALPTDHQLFALDNTGGRNRRMTFEALEIITQLWATGASSFRGEFWAMDAPTGDYPDLGYHLRPFQRPHPPIAIAAMTPGSENHKLAGAKGYIPVSLSISPDAAVTAQHWDAVEAGAKTTSRISDRQQWRIIRDTYVAHSDAEARAFAMGGMMGRCWQEFLIPLYLRLGLGPMLKLDSSMADSSIDVEYLCDHLWFVGSPRTVRKRIDDLKRQTGGFGTLVVVSYDARDEREAWENSLRLLTQDVLSARQSGLALEANA